MPTNFTRGRAGLLASVALSASCVFEHSGIGLEVTSGAGAADGTPDGGLDDGADADAAPSSAQRDGAGRDADAQDAESSAPPFRDADVDPVTSNGGSDRCRFEGTFALRIDADVQWAGTSLLDVVPIILPGEGRVSVTVLVTLQDDQGQRRAKIRACGAAVPDFSASVGERYGVEFPETVWDQVPTRWSVRARRECDTPGCTFATERVTAQLGLELGNGAAWPTSRDRLPSSIVRDDDRDGAPGIALRTRGPKDVGGPSYTHPPTSYLLTQRVREISLAVRVATDLAGSLESCDAYAGRAPAMTIDTRALGCRLDMGGSCNSEQLGFIDDNLPVWKVERASWKAVRVLEHASCAVVRDAVQDR